jgi:hypothetical protein
VRFPYNPLIGCRPLTAASKLRLPSCAPRRCRPSMPPIANSAILLAMLLMLCAPGTLRRSYSRAAEEWWLSSEMRSASKLLPTLQSMSSGAFSLEAQTISKPARRAISNCAAR